VGVNVRDVRRDQNEMLTAVINRIIGSLPRLFLTAALPLFALGLPVHGQTQTPTPSQQSDDVLRINTELVQTDVMVFDRRGQFVDGLKPEQFVLTLNGLTKDVSIFERVTSGSNTEAAQVNSSRSTVAPSNQNAASRPGRLIFFFVDDLHLSGESLARGRKALLHFIENQLNPEDRAAIVSSSGQIGFLQQLTDNSAVLHEAIDRLNYKKSTETYAGSTRISEYVASQIESGNRRLFAYLMESVKIEYGMGMGSLRGDHGNDSAGQAARLLRSRIGQINSQSKVAANNTLSVLESLMKSSANLPGRKLVFFLSDGFIVDARRTISQDILRQATRIAAQSGAVVYPVDMRGTFLDSSVDASNNDYVDMTSRHGGVSMGELIEPREPLNVLADETGGRLIINSTELDKDLAQAMTETSNYYLLAWRPDSEIERSGKARLEMSISGRPDLKVRLRRAYFVSEKSSPAKTVGGAKTVADPEVEILGALGSSQPLRTLPVSLSVGYVRNADAGFTLQAAMQIPRELFNFESVDAPQKSELDVIGAAIDDRGLIYSFKQVLTVTPRPAGQPPLPVIWNQHLNVRPGLYQLRVALRERSSGRTGSAMEWIEVPKAASPQLAMSSLFLGERRAESSIDKASIREPQAVPVEVDRRFAHNSVLRFQTYVYNAARTAGAPDVWIEARILRGNQPVVTVSPNKVPPDLSRDTWRLPYWSEIALSELRPGSYTLQVSATDRNSGASTSQRITFSIE
jgi:VWFA-related protein